MRVAAPCPSPVRASLPHPATASAWMRRLPLVFDMRHRCLRLLEGEFSDYNFGQAAELLFTPCEIPDEDYEGVDFSLAREEDAVTR